MRLLKGLSFSLRRAIGIARLKNKIARTTHISPLHPIGACGDSVIGEVL